MLLHVKRVTYVWGTLRVGPVLCCDGRGTLGKVTVRGEEEVSSIDGSPATTIKEGTKIQRWFRTDVGICDITSNRRENS